MYFQKVMQGLKDLSRADAAVMVQDEGIQWNWHRDHVFLQPISTQGFTICIPPFMTALQYATANFTTSGFVFYAFILNTQYLPYRRDGELIAKLVIPPSHIEKAEEYNGSKVLKDLRTGKFPKPVQTILNASYAAPDKYSNTREIV